MRRFTYLYFACCADAQNKCFRKSFIVSTRYVSNNNHNDDVVNILSSSTFTSFTPNTDQELDQDVIKPHLSTTKTTITSTGAKVLRTDYINNAPPIMPPTAPERRSGKTKFFIASSNDKTKLPHEQRQSSKEEQTEKETLESENKHFSLENEHFEETRNTFFAKANKVWAKLSAQNVSTVNERLELRRGKIDKKIKQERSHLLVFRDVSMDLDRPILSRDIFLIPKYFIYGKEFALDNELERMLRYYNEHAMQEIKLIANRKLMRGPASLLKKRMSRPFKPSTTSKFVTFSMNDPELGASDKLCNNKSPNLSSTSSEFHSGTSTQSTEPTLSSYSLSKERASILSGISNWFKLSTLFSSFLHNTEIVENRLVTNFNTPHFPAVRCAWMGQYCHPLSTTALCSLRELIEHKGSNEKDCLLQTVLSKYKKENNENGKLHGTTEHTYKGQSNFTQTLMEQLSKKKTKYIKNNEAQFITLTEHAFHRPAVVIITQSGQRWSEEVEWAWRKLSYATLCPSLLEYFPETHNVDGNDHSNIKNSGNNMCSGKNNKKSADNATTATTASASIMTHKNDYVVKFNIDVITLRSLDISSMQSIHRLHVSQYAKLLTNEKETHPILGALLASTTFVGPKLHRSFYEVIGLRNYLCPCVILIDHEGVIRWLSAGEPDEMERQNFPLLLRQLNTEYLRTTRQ